MSQSNQMSGKYIVCSSCGHDRNKLGSLVCSACGDSLVSSQSNEDSESKKKPIKIGSKNKVNTLISTGSVALLIVGGLGFYGLFRPMNSQFQAEAETEEIIAQNTPKLSGLLRYWSPPCNEDLVSNHVAKALSNSGRFKILKIDIGTQGAIEALRKGNISVAILEKAPFHGEEMKAKKLGYKVKKKPISLDGVAYIVNRGKTGVKSLTVAQVEKIYRGQITNWKQVGGYDLVINPVLLSGKGRNSLTLNFNYKLNPNTEFVDNRKVAIREFHKHEGGLFYTSATLAAKEKGVDIISLENEDGEIVSPVVEVAGKKQPNRQAFVEGRYPHLRTLIAVWLEGENSDEQEIVDGVTGFLASTEGQKLVKKKGFVPLYIPL